MNVNFAINDRLRVEADVQDVKAAFRFMAKTQDVLGVTECGNCGSHDLKYDYRQPQGYEYYSVKCKSCGHELKFGQARESGDLFQKGWEPPYKKEQDDSEPASKGGKDDDSAF